MLVGEKYQDSQLQFPIGLKYIQGPVQQHPQSSKHCNMRVYTVRPKNDHSADDLSVNKDNFQFCYRESDELIASALISKSKW